MTNGVQDQILKMLMDKKAVWSREFANIPCLEYRKPLKRLKEKYPIINIHGPGVEGLWVWVGKE